MFGKKLFRGAQSKAIAYGFNRYGWLRDRWVQWMQRLTGRLTARQLKMGVIAMVVMTVGYSSWIIVEGFSGTPSRALEIESIRQPAYVTAPSEPDELPLRDVSPWERYRLQRFLHYMDSLRLSPTGQKHYDHIHRARPGLTDSVRQLLQP